MEFPKLEVLPHKVEVALDLAQRAGSYVMRIVRNTNVPFPTMLPNETQRNLSEHYTPDAPQLPFES